MGVEGAGRGGGAGRDGSCRRQGCLASGPRARPLRPPPQKSPLKPNPSTWPCQGYESLRPYVAFHAALRSAFHAFVADLEVGWQRGTCMGRGVQP